MSKSEIVSRIFIKELPTGKEIFFNFKTRSSVFTEPVSNLHGFLSSLMLEGRKSYKRSPSSEKLLVLDVKKVESAAVQLAQEADYEGCEGWQHRRVQSFFMQRDNRTLAVEIPLWSEEIDMSGFADIIRYFPSENGKPEIFQLLDFKPKAKSERKAATQLHFTKKLLSECARIPLENIKCVYFDNQAAYEVLT